MPLNGNGFISQQDKNPNFAFFGGGSGKPLTMGSVYNTGNNGGGGGLGSGGFQSMNADGSSSTGFNLGAGYGGAPGGTGGGNSGGISGLINQQMQQNNQSRDQNQQNWKGALDDLLGVRTRYNADPTVQGMNRLTNNLMADPESLNDRTMGQIQARNSSGINGMMAAQLRNASGILAANGQTDAASMMRERMRIANQGMYANANSGTQLDIARAQNRNNDIQNAIRAGQGVSGQQLGMDMGVAQNYMQNLPQYRPDDLSGLIALLGNGQNQQQSGQQMNNGLNGMMLNKIAGPTGTGSGNNSQAPMFQLGQTPNPIYNPNQTPSGFGLHGYGTAPLPGSDQFTNWMDF